MFSCTGKRTLVKCCTSNRPSIEQGCYVQVSKFVARRSLAGLRHPLDRALDIRRPPGNNRERDPLNGVRIGSRTLEYTAASPELPIEVPLEPLKDRGMDIPGWHSCMRAGP